MKLEEYYLSKDKIENLKEKIGRYIINTKVQENSKEYILNIIKLQNKLCDLLIKAEKEINADFSQDFFINYIKTEKVFGFLELNSIDFTYKNQPYIVYNLDEKIKVEKF